MEEENKRSNKRINSIIKLVITIIIILLLSMCVGKGIWLARKEKIALEQPIDEPPKEEMRCVPDKNSVDLAKDVKPVVNQDLTRKKRKPYYHNYYKSQIVRKVQQTAVKFHPYAELGYTKFFNVYDPDFALSLDMFIPIWQDLAKKTIYTDLRYNDRTGKAFEANLHAGYRQLFDQDNKIIGDYLAFDRKKTDIGNYFNQLTFGIEYWQRLSSGNLFIGGNYYQPITGQQDIEIKTAADLERYNITFKNIGITKDLKHEKAMPGFDAEVGYEFKNGLAIYLGGYYFGASNMDTICGPKLRITYDWYSNDGTKKIGIEKLGLVLGMQKDVPRGFTWYLGINFRLNWLMDNGLIKDQFVRHMTDLVRRDVDIVSSGYVDTERRRRKEVIDGWAAIQKVPVQNLSNATSQSKKDTLDTGSQAPTKPPSLKSYNNDEDLKSCSANEGKEVVSTYTGQPDVEYAVFAQGIEVGGDKTIEGMCYTKFISDYSVEEIANLSAEEKKNLIRKPLVFAYCGDASVNKYAKYFNIFPSNGNKPTLKCDSGEKLTVINCSDCDNRVITPIVHITPPGSKPDIK